MNKIKRMAFGITATASVISAPILLISCGSQKQETITQTISKQEWIQNLVKKIDAHGKGLTVDQVTQDLISVGLHVDNTHGTSSKSNNIGDKYHDLENRFIPAFIKLTQTEKDNLTIQTFANLFETVDNADYHVATMVNTMLNKAFEAKTGTSKPTTSTTNTTKKQPNVVDLSTTGTVAPAVTPRTTIKETFFTDASKLKYADNWWDSSSTYTDKSELGRGTTFYKDLTKDPKTGFAQFDLKDWINVYDNEAKDLLNDPKHVYASTAPSGYSASNSQFGSIYNNKPNDASAQKKTGNNNNGLNAIYSGAGFGWDGGKKTFDTSFIEVIDNKPFSTSANISNGWEHVSPQSREKAALGDASLQTNKAIGDLHNLRPSIQDLFNGPRSNHPFGMVSGDSVKSNVDFEVGKSISNTTLTVAEPRVNVRGDIARIMFYMHDRYHIKYDLGYYEQLSLWAFMDPVTQEEKDLNDKIGTVMGFKNEYITGEKHIPYSAKIEQLVLNANADKSTDSHTWGKNPGIKLANAINTLVDASQLDWTKAIDMPFGSPAPSKNTDLKDAVATKQLIIKMTIKADNSIHYFKVTGLQSKAILAKEFQQTSLSSKVIKININSTSTTGLATLLTGNSRTSYTAMTDEVAKLEYIIEE